MQQKKLRQREEEDYLYKRNLERKKENDQYLTQKQVLEQELADKKNKLEKEFSEREVAIIAKEQELQNLKTQVEDFPLKLQKTIAETEKTTLDHVNFKHEYEVKLAQKEVEGERKLHQQMITALEAKIVHQDQLIKELTAKSNHAGAQVQEIAVKAIEGASRQQIFRQSYPERSDEQSKGQK